MEQEVEPQEFIAKWRNVQFGEKQASQEMFLDICALVEHDTPVAFGDPEVFTFVRLNELREQRLKGDSKITLTNLYNRRPVWLANAHAALDAAVSTAYGWPAGLDDAAILERLLALNLQRSE